MLLCVEFYLYTLVQFTNVNLLRCSIVNTCTKYTICRCEKIFVSLQHNTQMTGCIFMF